MSCKHCPTCSTQGQIYDSRHTKDYVRRRYKCRACALRWSTVEFVIPEDAHDVQGFLKQKGISAAREALAPLRAVLDLNVP